MRRVTLKNEFIEFRREEIEQSVPDRFERQVRLHPDRVAVNRSGPAAPRPPLKAGYATTFWGRPSRNAITLSTTPALRRSIPSGV